MPSMKDQFESAKAYIYQKDYRSARRVLRKIDHPKANEWLRRIDEIEPPVNRVQELWDSDPSARKRMIWALVSFGLLLATLFAILLDPIINVV